MEVSIVLKHRKWICIVLCVCAVVLLTATLKRPHNYALGHSSHQEAAKHQEGSSPHMASGIRSNINHSLHLSSLFLQPYISNIKAMTEELKHSNQTANYKGPIRHVVNAYLPDYFDKVSKIPSVRTVIWNSTLEQVQRFIPHMYYHYTSNNCSLVEQKSIYGQNWGQTVFGSKCQKDMVFHEELPLKRSYFQIGLPNKFHLPAPSIALTFLHVIASALVISHGDVFVGDTKLLIQRCSQNHSPTGRPKNIDNVKTYAEVLSLAQFWGDSFFHGTIEDLTRIGPYLGFLRDKPTIKVHLTGKVGFLKNLLQAMGISSKRLVAGSVKARILYLPAGTACGRPSHITTNLLSMHLRKSLLPSTPQATEQGSPPPVTRRDTIVLIKRSHIRFFKHHTLILGMVKEAARKKHMKVEVFSDNPLPSLQMTVSMFNRAVLVLGPHGAGFSNMILSHPGTVIMEGLCYNSKKKANLCYRNLARILGHKYYGLLYNKSCLDITANDIKPSLQSLLDIIPIS